jgi:hypothetical protein
MTRRGLKKTILLLFFLMAVLWGMEKAFALSPNFDFNIQSHHLLVQIDPSQHFLKAEDQLEINIKWGKPPTLSFLLHPKLKIIKMVDQKTGQPLHWSEIPFSAHAKRVDVSLHKSAEHLLLSISYEGFIYDPILKERGLQFVRGDQTTGLIGPEGVYLAPSTYWYPSRPDSLARFKVEATIPETFRIVTQGELVAEHLKDGHWKSKWVNDLPTENLTLVAGRYSVRTREAGGIKISTYFFPEDDRFSEVFLNAAEEYLKIYSDLLGPYPFKKFDIVQNFFSSGYGIPTFTLLAPETIRQGKEFLRPGALDHEIVHSWWGHYVSVKPGPGNWVEALTAYCTNYYYKELKVGNEAAQKYRQDVMQKYAIQVPPSQDYPLREFEGKGTELDGQIGYGKGSMVFHMLRKMVGKDPFFSTLKQFAMQYGGKQASWDDIRKSFEEASGKQLHHFFSQWLDRPGGPQLKLENVGVQVTSNGYLISGEVIQEGDVYHLLLPIEVDDGLGMRRLFLEVSKRRSFFSMEVPKIPLKLTLDPDDHLFRRLYPEEIIPGLNALLEDREKVFIVSDQGDEESRKIYFELARKAKEQRGGEILSIKEVTEEKLRNSSVMFLGEGWKDPIFFKLISNLPKPVFFREGSFFIKGDRVDEGDESLLLTFPNPLNLRKWVTIYFGKSTNALSRARYIFFYGWDSYLLFKNGRPKERGNFSPKQSFISDVFLSKDHLVKIESKKLRDHISYLVSPGLAGRFPGTSGYHKAQTYLIKQLEEMGVTPILQPFSIHVKDIEEATLILKGINEEEKLKAIPFRFSKEGKWKGPLTFIDESKAEEIGNISGKSAVLLFDPPPHLRPEQLFKKIKELQQKGAKAILFLIKDENLDDWTPYITYPSFSPPKLEESLKKRGREGSTIQPMVEASKVAGRAKEPNFLIHIPILFVPYARIEEGWIKKILDKRDIEAEIHLRFKEMVLKDSNIGGILEGNDPEMKKEFLVLGAHYDHLGKDEKNSFYYSGADDNASGVSSLLEIVRSLSKKKMDLKRSLLFLFWGGEEWGAWGSRHFVNHPLVSLRQIKAMFSLDTIGGKTDEKEVFLVGSTIYPFLAQRSRRFLEPLGMKEGKNIDQYAFEFGSDHYPFHQQGIPVLDFFASDYKKIHTSHDHLDSIDFEKLTSVTKLIYLTAYEFLTEL